VLRLFFDIHKAGTTVIIVTHDPVIGAQAKRCIKMLDGTVANDVPQAGLVAENGGAVRV